MAGLKKRKFSFDIPRLKIGPSKSDTKVLRDHLLSSQLDSPPPTPKSVRPPLSPYAEAELRAACAYVLQNFKPSHIVYEEQYGTTSQAKPQLDYAAIKSGALQAAATSPPALHKVTTIDRDLANDAEEDAESVSSERFRYKPETATEDLFKHDVHPQERANSRAAIRADQLMAPQRSNTTSAGTKHGHARHSRSASNPIRGMALTSPKMLTVERPRAIERTASAGTTGSTPETDNTDYPWSEKASTAMTSAALTPARSSKRTSSQAVASGSESSSMPKVDPVSADWMRQELEKHKQAHEARKQQGQELALEEAASSTVVSDTTPTQTTTQATTPVKAHIPARKPVPTSRSSSRQEALPPRTDSTQSVEQLHLLGKAAPDPPAPAVQRTASKRVAGTHRTDVRPANPQENVPQRKRSVSRVREYFRPGPAGETTRREGASRGVSRSASVSRHVKDYFRPSTSSRKPSVDLGARRSESRGRSIDSFRSTVSHVAPSVASASNKFKAFKTFHRGKKSDSSPDASRPGSSGSNKDGRGRAAATEEGSSQEHHAKPSVNLNRELPPLPSLDQWRSSSHSATPPISGSRLVSPTLERPDPIRSPRSYASQTSKSEKFAPAQRTAPTNHAEILAARMGSPTATRTRSSRSSVDVRAAAPPPQPTLPPPAPPNVSATMTSIDDLDYGHLAPTSSIDPVMAAEAKKDRRRSKSIQTPQPSERSHVTTGLRTVTKTPLAGKAAVVNTSRTAGATGGPPNFNVFRSPSKAVRPKAAITTMNTPDTHSRASSDHHNVPRKYSIDDYTTRMTDPRYQNMVEISVAQQASVAQLPTREKPKSKWWQRKDRKEQSPGWMDQVLQSGSSSGMILTDDLAGAPIVRY